MAKGLHKNSLRKVDNPHQWMIDDARMELIQQIKADVERRKKAIHSTLFNDEYNDFLSFLSDLEKSEKPKNPVLQDFPTTEKEMQDFLATHERIPVPERLNSLERILQEQPVCEGLEEEIYSFWDYFYGKDRRVTRATNIYDFGNIARHFAKWGAEYLKK